MEDVRWLAVGAATANPSVAWIVGAVPNQQRRVSIRLPMGWLARNTWGPRNPVLTTTPLRGAHGEQTTAAAHPSVDGVHSGVPPYDPLPPRGTCGTGFPASPPRAGGSRGRENPSLASTDGGDERRRKACLNFSPREVESGARVPSRPTHDPRETLGRISAGRGGR